MPQQPRLELTWIGKDIRPRLEPRILLEDSEKSYHAAERHSDADIFDNMLIHGDNLLASRRWSRIFPARSSASTLIRPTIPAAPLSITMMAWSIPSGSLLCGTGWKFCGSYSLKMAVSGLLLMIPSLII